MITESKYVQLTSTVVELKCIRFHEGCNRGGGFWSHEGRNRRGKQLIISSLAEMKYKGYLCLQTTMLDCHCAGRPLRVYHSSSAALG